MLGGVEIVIIAGIAFVILLRPKQVVELAKSFGNAVREFNHARQGKIDDQK